MNNLKKYRFAVWTLITVFFLFNVGVPIVIASCPMMQQAKPLACCAQEQPSESPSASINKDFSCCNTTIAAHRNITEFLQGKDNSISVSHHFSSPILQYVPNTALDYSQFSLSFFDSSPPADIPILHSTLLI
jgi:hypothetical protein